MTKARSAAIGWRGFRPDASVTCEQEESEMGKIRVGIGGWNFPEWRDNFYPKGLSQKLELKYASEHLTSIEINSTYYGSQKPESFQKWHDETPEGFVFAVKAPRFATNRKVLAEAAPSIDMFFNSGVAQSQGEARAGQLAVLGIQEIRAG